MKTQNRKGSTLIMTLMVFVVLMIFGTFILSFMVTENKQSIHHQNKTQAYYIARSGAVAVEATILDMDESQIKKLIDSMPLEAEVNNLSFENGSLGPVLIEKDGNDIRIKSKGIVKNIEENIEIIMKSVGNNNSDPELLMKHAIFGGTSINIQEYRKPTIGGIIATNSNKVTIYNNNLTTGEYTIDGRKYVISTNNNNPPYKNHIFNDDLPKQIKDIVNIKLPEVPSFNIPLLTVYPNNNEEFIQNGPNTMLNKSYKYKSFLVEWDKTLTIDTTNGDIIINTNKFENRGQILIKGNNNVIVYLEELTTHTGKNIIVNPGSNAKFKIYHVGSKQGSVNIYSHIPGDLYIEQASLTLNTNININGSVYNFGNQNKTLNVMGNIGKDLYIEKASLSLNTGTKVGGSVFNLSDKNVLLSIMGNIANDLYIKGATLTLNDACIIGGNIYQVGNNTNKVFLTGKLEGNAYIENANLEMHYNKKLEGDVYHFGNINSKVTINGSTDGNIYVGEANLFTHEGSVIGGNLHHQGSKYSSIELKGKVTNMTYLSLGKVVINSNKEWGGSIYYNGEDMKFESNHVKIKGSVYAPNANIKMDTQITIEGGIIGDKLDIGGYDINIKGNPDFYIPGSSTGNSDEKLSFERSHFKQR